MALASVMSPRVGLSLPAAHRLLAFTLSRESIAAPRGLRGAPHLAAADSVFPFLFPASFSSSFSFSFHDGARHVCCGRLLNNGQRGMLLTPSLSLPSCCPGWGKEMGIGGTRARGNREEEGRGGIGRRREGGNRGGSREGGVKEKVGREEERSEQGGREVRRE